MSKEEGGERLLRTPGQTDKSISGPEWADRGAQGSPTSGRREDGGPRPSQRPARGLSELYHRVRAAGDIAHVVGEVRARARQLFWAARPAGAVFPPGLRVRRPHSPQGVLTPPFLSFFGF